jgi:hypothetical protein
MDVHSQINQIADEIKREVDKDVDLNIGDIENPAEAVPTLCERMDRVCGLMDYQATLITYAEKALEETRYQFHKKELMSKKKYNEAFCGFKQEDRAKPKDQRRTDKEYEAMAELESHVEMFEALTSEREYVKSQHGLDDERHKYETLNNHFLSYRKAADLLMKEMNKIGEHTISKPYHG